MDALTLLLSAFAIATVYFLPRLLSAWRFFKIINELPTARDYVPILGHALKFIGPRKYLVKRCAHILKDRSPCTLWYGPVPVVVLIQPKHVEMLLGSADYIDKSFQYRFMRPWLGTGLVTSTGSKWHTHRKMITPTFHFAILESFVGVFAEKSLILVEKLEKELGSEEFDIFPYIGLCTLDIICETAMGIEINAQNQECQSEYVKAVHRVTEIIMHRLLRPWLFPDFIFNLSPSGREMANCVKVLHGTTNKIIQERKMHYKNKDELSSKEDISIGRKKRLAFLDLILENSENGKKLTDEEIREEVDTFLFAGHDTITAAISWSLQMLATHPDIQDKVKEELESIFEDSDRSPTIKDLNEMKYLERVIKETLRLYPSLSAFSRTLKEDLVFDGHRIPSGATVAVASIFTHRDEETYPNPEVFDPDRFLPEKISNRHPYAYIPFSAGPRNCIGQKFAMLELKTMLSYIIRQYKLHVTGEVPTPLPELITRPENGIHLRITKNGFNNARRLAKKSEQGEYPNSV